MSSFEEKKSQVKEFLKLNPKAKLFKKAVKKFGITSDFREAGYILPDGQLLDLSGKRFGGSPYSRTMDHREICPVIETKGKGIGGDECMDLFERRGAVRFHFTTADVGAEVNIHLNTYQKPSEKQMVKMRQSIMVCRRFGPCSLAYDIFYDDGGRCLETDEGYVENASQRDVDGILEKVKMCKIKERKMRKR